MTGNQQRSVSTHVVNSLIFTNQTALS